MSLKPIEIKNAHDVKQLIERFGDVKLSAVAEYLKAGRPYPCPKCGTTGRIRVNINTNMDSRDYNPNGVEGTCDLCDGYGYTAEKYEPVTDVVSYRKV